SPETSSALPCRTSVSTGSFTVHFEKPRWAIFLRATLKANLSECSKRTKTGSMKMSLQRKCSLPEGSVQLLAFPLKEHDHSALAGDAIRADNCQICVRGVTGSGTWLSFETSAGAPARHICLAQNLINTREAAREADYFINGFVQLEHTRPADHGHRL
ncbi:hypothetical protein BaRGS_00027406, partial [Batillaria attramentaria]